MSENPSILLGFLGPFHPLLVHLPIGFLVLLGLLEAAALRPAWRHLATANPAILALTLPAAAGAAICGWLLAGRGDYDPELLTWHRWSGVGVVVLTAVLVVLRRRGPTPLYRAGLAATLTLLGVAGHFGGSLTHGRDFLLQDAPPLLRTWLGSGAPPSRPAPTGHPLDAPVFEAAVQPLLDAYCVSCHGTEKAKGGLRLHTLAALLRGGDNGAIIVAGRSAESSLVQRLRLPPQHDDHMPPDGKRQPTPDEIAVLAWWIDTGAPTNRTVRELTAPETVLRTLGHREPAATR